MKKKTDGNRIVAIIIWKLFKSEANTILRSTLIRQMMKKGKND